MALEIYANTGVNDVDLDDSSGEFTLVSPDNDRLIISSGSDTVADGEPIPSQSQFRSAGVRIDQGQVIIDKYFLADLSANELKQIHNMGNQNKRYVMLFSFDEATASEPVLEVWDDELLESIDDVPLGGGTPSNSYWRGIVTTNGLPGAGWAVDGGVIRLAGSSDNHFLLLNDGDGALPGAAVLSCNLAVVVPNAATESGGFTSKIAVKWLES